MAKKLTQSQRAAMIWLSKGWKAYVASGNKVEVNGHYVCTVSSMTALEAAGLIEREGVAAWTATAAGKEWRGVLNPD